MGNQEAECGGWEMRTFSRYKAHAPATSGAAMEVPLLCWERKVSVLCMGKQSTCDVFVTVASTGKRYP